MTIQAEQEIIACLMAKNSLMQNCNLTAGQFESESFGEIYGAISSLCNDGKVADIVTLADLLRGNRQDILSVAVGIVKNSHANTRGFDSYVEMVSKSFKKRSAMGIAIGLQYSINEDGDLGAIDKAISDLMAIDTSKANYSHTMNDCISASLVMIEEAHETDGLVGISTGLQILDEAIAGFHPSDLNVIGARPAMGKTAMLLNMANGCKVNCGIISAEQGHAQVGSRFIGMNGSVDGHRMRTGAMKEEDWPKLTAGVSLLKDRGCYINDEPGINIINLVKQAREWKFKYGIKILYVDYIQKIKGSDQRRNRTEQVTEVTAALKNLARELKIPVVALAQVKREVESRPDKRPSMGDMSDASEIEKEADSIMTLYRDEVYNTETMDKGVAEVDICKNRHGHIGMLKVQFIGQYMQFKDLQPSYQGQY